MFIFSKIMLLVSKLDEKSFTNFSNLIKYWMKKCDENLDKKLENKLDNKIGINIELDKKLDDKLDQKCF